MVIRRGGAQILRGLPRNMCDSTSSNSGMPHVKKILNRYVTAMCFSKQQLGSVAQRRLGVMFATDK